MITKILRLDTKAHYHVIYICICSNADMGVHMYMHVRVISIQIVKFVNQIIILTRLIRKYYLYICTYVFKSLICVYYFSIQGA